MIRFNSGSNLFSHRISVVSLRREKSRRIYSVLFPTGKSSRREFSNSLLPLRSLRRERWTDKGNTRGTRQFECVKLPESLIFLLLPPAKLHEEHNFKPHKFQLCLLWIAWRSQTASCDIWLSEFITTLHGPQIIKIRRTVGLKNYSYTRDSSPGNPAWSQSNTLQQELDHSTSGRPHLPDPLRSMRREHWTAKGNRRGTRQPQQAVKPADTVQQGMESGNNGHV